VTLSLLGLLALIATLYDGCREYCNQPIDLHVACLPVRVFHCFSVLNNGRKILRTRVNSTDNLGCINGLRVLSTTWVVMGHSYFKAREHSIYDDMVLHQVRYPLYKKFIEVYILYILIGIKAVAISRCSYNGDSSC